jgi:hypothetical protein
MTNAIVSLGLVFFAVALLAGVLLVPTAFVAGTVFHVWGTSSTLECFAEALRRVFAGGLRRRVMRAVNRQSYVGVDRSRQICPYLVVSVAPGDVPILTGPGGDLSSVATDAVKGYIRNAKAQGWASDTAPQLAIVPEEWLRRGSARVRPVSGQEFIDLWREMVAWDQTAQDDLIAPAPVPAAAPVPEPAPTTRVDRDAEHRVTQRLSDADVVTATVVDPAYAVTMSSASARIVLADAQGAQHPISSPSVLIGRGPKCGVQLDGADVSREHVDVYFQEGTWWLRDRGSRNGTTVDGREVKGAGPVPLTMGSQIVLGGENAGEKLTISSLVEL